MPASSQELQQLVRRTQQEAQARQQAQEHEAVLTAALDWVSQLDPGKRVTVP